MLLFCSLLTTVLVDNAKIHKDVTFESSVSSLWKSMRNAFLSSFNFIYIYVRVRVYIYIYMLSNFRSCKTDYKGLNSSSRTWKA